MPTVSAHIPTCADTGGDELNCADAPQIDEWLTCGQTPSTWPSCGIQGAKAWCSMECFVWEQVVFAIIFHCWDHLRIDHEFCGATLDS